MNNSLYSIGQNTYPAIAQANSMRLSYLNQFPYQYVQEQSNGAFINSDVFNNNWNAYWENILRQQNYSQQEQQRRSNLVRSIAKEIIGQKIKSTGNKQASLAYDTMCAITAPNIFEAVAKAISVITTTA